VTTRLISSSLKLAVGEVIPGDLVKDSTEAFTQLSKSLIAPRSFRSLARTRTSEEL